MPCGQNFDPEGITAGVRQICVKIPANPKGLQVDEWQTNQGNRKQEWLIFHENPKRPDA
jgi:hypothetical protein